MRGLGIALCAGLIGVAPLAAQQQHVHTSEYAGQQRSEIPSLTPQQLEELRTGAGMGMALPAELNHFPGPRHVLDLADSLGLSADQRSRVEVIRARMSDAAVRLGAQIIEKERELNQRFNHAHIDAAALRGMVSEIARLQGELRVTHLAAHLETTALLSAEQVRAYDRLRGYTRD